MNKENNQQPFKKRVEVVFSDSDRDIWEWLEKQTERKATFIKKTLRNVMNSHFLKRDEIQQMIKKEVQKAVSEAPLSLKDNEKQSGK